MSKVTAEDVVLALKAIGRTVSVKCISKELGGADTRAIATAARKPAADGRIRVRYKGPGQQAWYRFVRLTPRPKGER